MLKYLNTKRPNLLPKSLVRYPIEKYLRPRPASEANKNIKKFTEKNPAESVKTLYGIGVKAAENIARNAFGAKS